MEWETRKAIGSRATTALWLHAYYSSHTDPYPIREEKLHELCRSGDKLNSFRRSLEAALIRLVKVGFLAKYEYTDGMVKVSKKLRPNLISVIKK